MNRNPGSVAARKKLDALAYACAVCGASFTPRTVGHRYCSAACAKEGVRASERARLGFRERECVCAVCRKPFRTMRSRNRTCSAVCSLELKRRGSFDDREKRRRVKEAAQAARKFAVDRRDMALGRSGPNTFTTRRCAVCNALVEKSAMKSGCCSDACATALSQRVTVRCLSSQVAVGERVLVSRCETRTLSGCEHLVQVSDAGTIVGITDGRACINVGGRTITAPVADIATMQSAIDRVRESMGDSSYEKNLRRKRGKRLKSQSISA